ncbi:hypothetical protein JDV02_005564 [Purpureocillium takamizusanense]|uniref:Flavin-binding monooxygenase n=1 Tax=Purpureocillium takamizusanense TaxID=2060973 RepID=A0A9Q8QID1_9HYPO|nr:uncharacterized protein JDV02_005564 [Purpureocillium takamizusanense]UNI19379.1 hypothetical protein JDV02_005564 [Purpureocillium takamizusanense]
MGKSASSQSPQDVDFEVIIVGAGISGINAAYRVKQQAPPGTRLTILEGRDSIGGTWDLFRYPGIRSDSDIFTFGFSWNPWPHQTTLGLGAEIKEYLIQSAKVAGVDEQIRYQHKVTTASWVSGQNYWEVSVSAKNSEKPKLFRTRFLVFGTGYYDYDQPLEAVIPGIKDFKGKVIHPQFWPKDYDYTNKEMVVIGSGATAVTIVPSVADKVKHVTMLQRSPTYIFPLPQYPKLTSFMFALMPSRMAQLANRLLWIIQGYLMIAACRTFPGLVRRVIRAINKKLLPPNIPCDPHFTPRYKPWEQRVCASLDGDFFAALRSGKASVATDTIVTVTEDTIELNSGAVIRPDVIVTATGLKLKFGGGVQFSVDGKPLDPTKGFMWKSSMIQDLPNVVFCVGYQDASWTLGADCAAQLLTRLMWELRSSNATVAMPHLEKPEEMEVKPLMSLSATYLKNINKALPKAGTGSWRPRTHYTADLYAAKWGDIRSGLLIK